MTDYRKKLEQAEKTLLHAAMQVALLQQQLRPGSKAWKTGAALISRAWSLDLIRPGDRYISEARELLDTDRTLKADRKCRKVIDRIAVAE